MMVTREKATLAVPEKEPSRVDAYFAAEAARLPQAPQVVQEDEEPTDDFLGVLEISDKWRRCPSCSAAVPQSAFVEPVTDKFIRKAAFGRPRSRQTRPTVPFACPHCSAKIAFRRPDSAKAPWVSAILGTAVAWPIAIVGWPDVVTERADVAALLWSMPIWVFSGAKYLQRRLIVVSDDSTPPPKAGQPI